MTNNELSVSLKSLGLTESVLKSLSEEEKSTLLQMVDELQQGGSSDTLKSLWYEDYDEIPVDIDTFIDDPLYLGNSLGNTLYPFWREQLREIFKPGAKYFEVVLSGGIGLGKTTIANVGMAYILHKLLCLKNPQSYYGLTKSSIITINFFNVSMDLAYGVSFNKMQGMLLESPWFMERGTVIGSKNLVYSPGKNIEFKVGSKSEHALGQDVFCLTGDTEILTNEYGYVKLSDVEGKPITVKQVDDKLQLVTSDPCYVQLTKKSTQLVELTLEDGSVLKSTPEHRFMLTNGDYVRAIDINEGDDLLFLKGGDLVG